MVRCIELGDLLYPPISTQENAAVDLELNQCFREHHRNLFTVTLATYSDARSGGSSDFESGTLKAAGVAVVYLAAGD